MTKRTVFGKSHVSRRDFLEKAAQAGAGLAGLAFLAACGSAAPAGGDTGSTASAAAGDAAAEAAPSTAAVAPEGGPGSISMLGWGSPLEKANVEAGLKQFQEANPGITVEWLHTPQDYPTKLKTMLAGGTPPDVFWANNVLDYVARDTVLDVTDYVNADPVLSKSDYFLQPQEEDRATINGKWYGIGSCWVVPHLYYNTQMLTAAGIEPPSPDVAQAWSWEQFVDAAKKLTIDTNGKHPGDPDFDANNINQWGVSWPNWSLLREAMVYSNGGDAFTKDYACKLGDPAAVEAIQSLADLANVHKVAPLTAQTEQLGMNSMQMLASNKLAILADGSWALQDIAKLGFEYGAGVLPMMKEAVTDGTAHLHVISTDTKNVDASWKLLAYLSSDDYQRGLCKVGLWLPSHTTLLTPEGLATWITEGVHPAGYDKIATEYLTKHTKFYLQPAGFEEANTLITSALDPVWIGQAKAADVLTADLIKQVDDIVAKTSEKLKA